MVIKLDGSNINCERWEDYWKSLVCTWGTWKFYVFGKEFCCPRNPAGKTEKAGGRQINVFLHSAFFRDVLAEAKKFSLLTQEKNVNVIKLWNAVKSTKSNYERLLKKIQVSNDYILTLPNFKIIDGLESNEKKDGEPLYHGHKLVNYSREKRYLLDHAQYIRKKIRLLWAALWQPLW